MCFGRGEMRVAEGRRPEKHEEHDDAEGPQVDLRAREESRQRSPQWRRHPCPRRRTSMPSSPPPRRCMGHSSTRSSGSSPDHRPRLPTRLPTRHTMASRRCPPAARHFHHSCRQRHRLRPRRMRSARGGQVDGFLRLKNGKRECPQIRKRETGASSARVCHEASSPTHRRRHGAC